MISSRSLKHAKANAAPRKVDAQKPLASRKAKAANLRAKAASLKVMPAEPVEIGQRRAKQKVSPKEFVAAKVTLVLPKVLDHRKVIDVVQAAMVHEALAMDNAVARCRSSLNCSTPITMAESVVMNSISFAMCSPNWIATKTVN